MSVETELHLIVTHATAPLLQAVEELQGEVRQLREARPSDDVRLRTKAAAVLMGVRPDTISGWGKAGLITRYGTDSVALYSRAELLALTPQDKEPKAEVIDIQAMADRIRGG